MAKNFSIENWMTGELLLSGNELVCFAFLWSETKGGREKYEGGYTELALAMGVTVPTTYNVLRKLSERLFILFGDVKNGITVLAKRPAA